MRKDAEAIYKAALRKAMPDDAIRASLKKLAIRENLVLVAIGKAAWRMANTACQELGTQIVSGAVITKYGHSDGPITNLVIYEAGHPILDEEGLKATESVLNLIDREKNKDGIAILFLVSGGGSALFESLLPGVRLEYIRELNEKLLACGANIHEINTIRKLFSTVKGGRFAQRCAPSKIYQIVLSDVLGDDLSAIASGPAACNHTTAYEIREINEKYSLGIDEQIIEHQYPTEASNVTTIIAANVSILCRTAAKKAEMLGYSARILDDNVVSDVEDLADRIYNDAKIALSDEHPHALIYGGEPTVHVKGKGMGGRNQELALLMAQKFAGQDGLIFVSCGSDGTDGPTDAAGGIIDGSTWDKIKQQGLAPSALLADNDSNHALAAANALIVTGPTGTNVNDLIFLLTK